MKKALALLLALTMVFALCVPAAFAEGPAKTLNYVTLGASNSNGYGLHGYLEENQYNNPLLKSTDGPGISGFDNCPAGSYPDLLVKYFEEDLGYKVNHSQYAQSSMRIEELRFLLDESYTGDGYTKWRFYNNGTGGKWWDGCLDKMRADYKDAITNADLITFDMGINNFGAYVTNTILYDMYEKYGGCHIEDIDPAIADKYNEARDTVESIITSYVGDAIDEGTMKTLESMVDTLAYALVGYCYNFDKVIGMINDMSDAKLVVMSIQNVMAGFKVSLGGTEIPFGDIFGVLVKLANTYMSITSPYKDTYVYADVCKDGRVTYFMDQLLAWDGDPDKLDRDMKDMCDVYDTSIPLYARFRIAGAILGASEKQLLTELNKGTDVCGLAKTMKPELYELGCRNLYDILMTFCKESVSTNPVVVDELLKAANPNDFFKVAEKTLVSGISALFELAINTTVAGQEVSDEAIYAIIDQMFTSDGVRAVACIDVRSGLGNTFFTHPNRQGHQELYQGILNALASDTSGTDAFAKKVDDLNDMIIDASVKYGTAFTYSLIEKVAAQFGVDANVTDFLKDVLPDSDIVANVLIGLIGITTDEQFTVVGDCVREAASEFVGGVHTLRHVSAKHATFFSSGNTEYYVCNDCGKCFSDPMGQNEISRDDTVIEKLGIKDLANYLINLFTKLFDKFFALTGPKSFG